jgi:hypothetical protein
MANAITLNASLKWPDVKDDYVVRYEGRVIGRMRLGGERYAQGNTWEWSIDIPMAMPPWASGSAESRDACMKDFTAAWGRLIGDQSGTPRARLGVGASVRGTIPEDGNQQNGRKLARRLLRYGDIGLEQISRRRAEPNSWTCDTEPKHKLAIARFCNALINHALVVL